jgi:hypothetical protein
VKLRRLGQALPAGFINAKTLAMLALLVVALLTIPSAGHPMTAGGEYEYQAALTVAFREHMQWGSQIIWTYGPLGYMNVLADMDFGTWLPALIANLAAHAAFFGVLALFLIRISARPWHWLAIGAIILVFFERYPGFEFERFPVLDHKVALIAVMLLYLASEAQTARLAALLSAAGGLAVGFLLLDKGTYIIFAGGLVSAYAILGVTRREPGSIGSLLGGIVFSFFALWLVAGQHIAGVPSYFRSSYEILTGYTAAMSWFSEAPAAHPTLQLSFAIAMMFAAGLGLLFALWRRDRTTYGLQLLSLPLLLIAYKNSFTRFDEAHAITFWSLAAVLQGLVLVRISSAKDGRLRKVPAVLAGGTVIAAAVLVLGLGPVIGKTPVFMPAFVFPDNLATYRHAVSLIVRPDRRSEEEQQVQVALRALYPLPPDVADALRQGDVDVLPMDVELPFAYGFRWNPQPVFQANVAWRPYLDEQDALHYMGPNAPRFVIFNAADIDGRYPLFDGPKTYRVLLEHYQVRFLLPDLLVLEKRSDVTPSQEIALTDHRERLGEWINVPAHDNRPLYGRVNVRYSPIGLAMNLVDRPPELHIRFRYDGGQVSPWYRFIPAVAPDGLLLTSYAPDAVSFADLADGRFVRLIEAFQITANAPPQAYEQDVGVSYFTVGAG